MNYLEKAGRVFCSLFFFVWLVSCSSKSSVGQTQADHHHAENEEFMIVSQGYWTTLAAKEMFEAGGNFIDAATAASFTTAVERPQSTGIGGGGFMLIRHADDKKIEAVDFRETAPLKSEEKMFQDASGEVVPKLSTDGIFASATPGMVAGVLEVHRRYGKLPLTQVLRPAIHLAENGILVYPHLADAIAAKRELLKQYPASQQIFLKANAEPYEVGDILIQKDLGQTLRRIAEQGRAGFYQGQVAAALLAEHKRLGGNLQQADLDTYEVKFREPVRGRYDEYDIYSMPPPSSGGVHVIQILNLVEAYNLRKLGAFSPKAVHLTASAMQLAFADRARFLGDTDFVDVPLSTLTSKAYAEARRLLIKDDRALRFQDVKAGDLSSESLETTHFTIADKEGNIVASTQTINGWLGSGIVVPEAGFVLNNEMDDFSSKPGTPNNFGVIGGYENAIRPKKRPLSSMSPTIVEKEGKPVLALGSPSGSQIITCVSLTILNYLEYEMPLPKAVNAPRYHNQWTPDQLLLEGASFSEPVKKDLEVLGHDIKEGGIGCKIQALAFESGTLIGVSDKRGEGLSLGAGGIPEAPRFSPKTAPVIQD